MPNSLNRLFRRLREETTEKLHRHRGSPSPAIYGVGDAIVSGCCSRRTSSTLSHPTTVHNKGHSNRKGSNSSAKSALISAVPLLPDPLLFRVFDALENPFELFPLRRVSRATAKYVQLKLQSVAEIDLRRVSFEELSSSSTSTGSSSTSALPDTSVFMHGHLWHVHPSGCKVLCRIFQIESAKNGIDLNSSELSEEIEIENPLRLEVLVDEQWTSREIGVICSLVNEFRRVVRRISMDAPIFELIVANLASVDLDHWFAFQCFVKAVDECQMNTALNKLASQLQQQDEPAEGLLGNNKLYWPKAKNITVRTTERESVHLARVLNYGVRSNLVMDRRRLDCLKLQVSVTDAAQLNVSMAERPKYLVRNLYHFRCWAGSPGFDERFSQQWRCVNNRVS